MRKVIVPLMAASMFCTLPMLSGCDRTVSKEETTKTSPNGDTSKSETTVKQTPNGDIVKEHSSSTDNTHSNP